MNSINFSQLKNFSYEFSGFIMKSIFTISMVIFISFAGTAQENMQIIEFSQLSSEKTSRQLGTATIDAKKIKTLIVDLHPSVYLENGKINFYSEAPTTAFLDLKAINSPINRDARFENIEFVSIRIDQRNADSQIDLSRLKVFPNLKYIFFACSSECNESQIRNIITDLKEAYTIIYRSENQS